MSAEAAIVRGGRRTYREAAELCAAEHRKIYLPRPDDVPVIETQLRLMDRMVRRRHSPRTGRSDMQPWPEIPVVPIVLAAIQMPDDMLWQALADEQAGVPGATARVDRALEAARMRAAMREVE
ncbi:hypothetical protein CLG96_06685 [Sphingomonas oleivorans]|uniref:Uncharacterized protein n=1 Tax=Sphingomonas oleivorans TaxID=1735121 RepID=A0A2T5FZU8_9SPHN|nr:hypothetical protein [Sphingomonas oleivorans]PTQ12229.1 hypothetical protein CLG96_06685 [Sphingomonas oleivorans]